MGYGVFQTTNILKWDQWKENGKYLIPYDSSDLKKKAEEKTLRIALETIESISNLKFVKYDNVMINNCSNNITPCCSGLKIIVGII